MISRFGSMLMLCSLMLFSAVHVFAQSAPSSPAEPAGVISGKILAKEGTSLAGGAVLFYDALTGPAPLKNPGRVPMRLCVIGDDGQFRAELPPGKYYLRAMKRISRGGFALQNGDYFYDSVDDKGEAKVYLVQGGAITDIGTIADVVPLKKTEDVIRTSAEGVITDTVGKPVEGVFVFAFRDPSISRMPVYFSRNTGPDGKYVLPLSAGIYYVRVRNKLRGGPPHPGDLIGTFGGETPVRVSIRDGEIKKNINITVMKFRGRGPVSGTSPQPGSQK